MVGSVTASTNADGDLVSLRHADAFGNTLEDWETGLWTGGSGWGHNTKEQSAATGLVYMYQRHYLPETGTFLSTAPYPPMIEHEYTFAAGNPVDIVDIDGMIPRSWRRRVGGFLRRTPKGMAAACVGANIKFGAENTTRYIRSIWNGPMRAPQGMSDMAVDAICECLAGALGGLINAKGRSGELLIPALGGYGLSGVADGLDWKEKCQCEGRKDLKNMRNEANRRYRGFMSNHFGHENWGLQPGPF